MSTIYLILAGLAAVAIVVWFAIRAARGRGRAEERAKQAEAGAKAAKEAREIEDEVDGMTEKELDDALDADRRPRGRS